MDRGDVVAGRFVVERPGGSGGMGTVWRATDRQTGAPVAVKVMQDARGQHAQRLLREASVLAEVAHPCVVRYVAHGLLPSGAPYLAMEWLEGEDLSERIDRAGHLSIPETLGLGRSVAAALAEAHARGVVHRDVKPGNVFLVGRDAHAVKLLDFGIARLARATSSLTGAGGLIGTPGYLAPEQARGAPDIGPAADVFALGCVLFECLTGRPAFLADHALALLAKILFETAPSARALRHDVSAALDDLVARMMARDPAGRPRDGRAVLDELTAIESAPGDAPRPTAPARRGITEGEMRLVSVVVAARRDEEPAALAPTILESLTAARETLASQRDEVAAAVAEYGVRTEWLADGSLAAIVAEQASATDQVARAARCALALRARVKDALIVVATGHARVDDHGPLVGQAFDRAAALLRLPPGGSGVRIDRVTADLLDARFEVRSGDGAAVLVGERSGGDASRTLLGRHTRFVGRDRELAVLEALADEAFGEPVARVALVTAPTGLGKTRLRQELVSRLAARDPPVQLWTARGDPMSAGSPFGLLGQALRRAVGILEGEPLEQRRRKLLARAARTSAAAEAERVAEFLGELLGAPFEGGVQLRAAREDARLMGDQMRRAWEDLVAAECSERPLVVVLDDLQWGDLPSVGFIDAALRHARDRPLLVLAFARPEVRDVFPDLWADRGVQPVVLGELTRSSSEKLVREALGPGVDKATVARIVERGSGNPLLLEELVRAQAEGGGEDTPETVVALVQARLERIPEDARRVLRAASIFGGAFWRGGLVELLGGPERAARLDEWLAHLVEREVVVARGESKFAGEKELVFRHPLVREAAYAMLVESDRTLGHAVVGGWLERAGERDAVALAEHFERGGQGERAIAWWSRAAEDALAGDDADAAVSRARRGVACGAAGEALGALLAIEAEGHGWRGRERDALGPVMQAMAVLPRGSRRWFAAAGTAGTTRLRLGEVDAVGRVAEELLGAPVEDRDRVSATVSLLRVATQLLFAGQGETATALVARADALTAGEPSRDANVVGWRRSYSAYRAVLDGRWLDHIEDRIAALDAYLEAGDMRSVVQARANLGAAWQTIGEYGRAEQELRAALVGATRLGLRAIESLVLVNLGTLCVDLGRAEEGLGYIELSVSGFLAQGHARMLAGSHLYAARALLRMGRPDDAERHAHAAVERTSTGAFTGHRAYAFAMLAQVKLARDDAQGALEVATEAMRVLEGANAVEDGASAVRMAHARCLWACGRADDARAAIARAREAVLASAATIGDERLRAAFLENIPENRETIALARAWVDGD